jgi:hypothetical protein
MMNDLVKIHSYYVYNLESFQKVFLVSMEQAPKQDSSICMEELEPSSEQIQHRCLLLMDIVTKTIFDYVQRGVFISDKLTVITLLTLRILVNDGKMSQGNMEIFISSRTSPDPGNMGPLHEWLPGRERMGKN